MLAEKKKYAMDLINKIPDSSLDNIIIYLQDILDNPDYNTDTLEAMKEIEDMEKNPDKYKGYASAKEMIEDILDI